jgi:hypothetical protein
VAFPLDAHRRQAEAEGEAMIPGAELCTMTGWKAELWAVLAWGSLLAIAYFFVRFIVLTVLLIIEWVRVVSEVRRPR